MMKKNWIYLLLFLVAACAKEDQLTPSVMKNWYVIEPHENMDAVDQKIYDIYVKYGVAVFYRDTIGVEDRGWKDENGNPELFYEVLKPNYDIEEAESANTKLTWNKVDVSTKERKEKLLPMLELLDEQLLDILDGVDIHIAAIFLVQNMQVPTKEYLVYRGFNLMSVAVGKFETGTSSKEYVSAFLYETCYRALDEELASFQSAVTSVLGTSSASTADQEDPWGKPYSRFEPNYFTLRAQVMQLDAYVVELEQKSAERDRLLEQLTGIADETEKELLLEQLNLCEGRISELQENLKDEDNIRASFEEMMYYKYGWMELIYNMVVPTKEQDLNMYLLAAFTREDNVFMASYAHAPAVQVRYFLILQALKEVGFDIEKVKSILD